MYCDICGSAAELRYEGHPGYIAGHTYDIYACSGCGSSFAAPLHVEAGIYEHIYANAARISGYDRYARYAQLVADAADPRAALAAREDVYFAVDAMLRRIEAPRPQLLEIGSGFGYLTYALARSGCAIEGHDVSDVAVRAATDRFGPYYHVRDIFAPANGDVGRFDGVIMTELIEHVPDPAVFLRAARRLLAPRGRFIMTTPNKSFYAPAPLWETDPPPVHLWWLTERAIDVLGERLSMAVHFFDFSAYNDRRPPRRETMQLTQPTRTSMLDAAGTPLRDAPRPEPRRLFPISQSMVPPVAGTLRSAARALRLRRTTYAHGGRRATCAFEMIASE